MTVPIALPTWPEPKAPAENLDYGFDWSAWLGTDTLATSTYTVPTGLTAGTAANTSTGTTQYMSGGALGQDYIVKNAITTAAGRTAERSAILQVRLK